jgi:polyhydroxybutyrate depolymerase
MLLHNPRDRQVSIGQALRARDAMLDQNHLPPGSEATEPHRFNCRRYGPEGAGYPVLWCPHSEDVTGRGRFYPHQWPAGTGAVFMEFFAGLH